MSSDSTEVLEPFTEADVDVALRRMQRVHEGHMSAMSMWLPIADSLRSTRDQQRYT